MNKKSAFTCIVIDDEPIAIKVIREHLEKLNQIECIGGYTKPLEAIDALNEQKVDLLFLDINMPGISGIEFLKSLAHPPKVIFTTAYRNFAVDAFELNALDYIVKPISFERFLKSINKFLAVQQPLVPTGHKENQDKDHIILKADKKNHKIKYVDILYIESLDNYIKLFTKEASIICYESLANLEKELPNQFLRIHRSYIVNVSKVDVFTSSYVEIDKRRFTIGRNYRDAVSEKLTD